MKRDQIKFSVTEKGRISERYLKQFMFSFFNFSYNAQYRHWNRLLCKTTIQQNPITQRDWFFVYDVRLFADFNISPSSQVLLHSVTKFSYVHVLRMLKGKYTKNIFVGCLVVINFVCPKRDVDLNKINLNSSILERTGTELGQ